MQIGCLSFQWHNTRFTVLSHGIARFLARNSFTLVYKHDLPRTNSGPFFFLFNISTRLFLIKIQFERMIFITLITYFVTRYIVPFKDTCFFNPLPYKLITIIAKRYKRIINKNCKNRS